MTSETEKPSGRVMSIDALRGFDMLWITGGTHLVGKLLDWIGSPALQPIDNQMSHSEWNGFTAYDLIFPLFLFIVGTSMPFALSKRVERGDDKWKLFLHVLRRAATLYVLGLVYNGILGLDFGHMRWVGVLHRIAICYLIAGVVVLTTGIRGQAIIAASVLLFYWAIMTLVPVPGIGAGVLTPEGNLAGYIDRLLLPGRFCCYELGDNEGLLSTIPAISTALLGVLSGHWLRTSHSGGKKAAWLACAGLASLALSLAWNVVFPINKLLWSSSYVLCAGGCSMLLLALFYWVIDVQGYQKWAFPFVVIGMNAITIYMVHGVFDSAVEGVTNAFFHGVVRFMGDFKPVFQAGSELAVGWLFLYFLYRKKIFLKA
jgi:predicted acyltransferase